MPVTNAASGTNVAEIAPGIYRINTPITAPDGWRFSFNQYLLAAEEPLLFHTGPRRCGDLFTQAGHGKKALVETDILGPSEKMRAGMDYYSHTKNGRAMIERLAATSPQTLACMHGSAWRGDGAALLRSLADVLDPK